jgi:hypothetical protein
MKRQPYRPASSARAVDWFAQLGIRIRRVMTDTGPASMPTGSATPASNSKSAMCALESTRRAQPARGERFIQTAIREWAYGRLYLNSTERTACLPSWIHRYNWHRPHTALNQ